MRFELRTTSDGSQTVFDLEAGECYKSRHAARMEAEHVFYRPAVMGNPFYGKEKPFRVLELGFGLGTNFLHFLARGFEGELLSIERDLSGASFFLEQQPDPALKSIVSERSFRRGGLNAEVQVGDFLGEMRKLSQAGYGAHAILFDPFSPKANPESWSKEVFRLAAGLLVPGGRLVTYSVSRSAKDNAQAAGLEITKHKLPPELRKRSAMLATKPWPG